MSIHYPHPGKRPNRLLASHHSIYEALQDRSPSSSPSMPDDIPNTTSRSPRVPQHEYSVTSWQSIADGFFAPRPTSSVLSSSDTEEDEVAAQEAPFSVSDKAIEPASATTIKDPHEQGDEEKTIEINMNEGVQARFSFGLDSASSFVMPEFANTPDPLTERQTGSTLNKILIIGHKRQRFYRRLEPHARERFSLDPLDPHKFIIVIFHDLHKIGNIKNFIRSSCQKLEGKIFIPVFKDLHPIAVSLILRVLGVELLCPPVSLDDAVQIQNLIDFLNEDFLFQSTSFVEHPTTESFHVSLPAADITPEAFQLIRINSGDTENSDLAVGPYPQALQRASSAKSVLVSHQVERLSSSKKMKSREQAYPKWAILGVTLTVGVGIGVTLAFAVSYFNKKPPEIIIVKRTPWKSFTSAASNGSQRIVRNFESLLRAGVRSFSGVFGDASKLVWRGTKSCLDALRTEFDMIPYNVQSVCLQTYTLAQSAVEKLALYAQQCVDTSGLMGKLLVFQLDTLKQEVSTLAYGTGECFGLTISCMSHLLKGLSSSCDSLLSLENSAPETMDFSFFQASSEIARVDIGPSVFEQLQDVFVHTFSAFSHVASAFESTTSWILGQLACASFKAGELISSLWSDSELPIRASTSFQTFTHTKFSTFIHQYLISTGH